MNDFKLFEGFDYGRTDGQTDIGGSRVDFATENKIVCQILRANHM